MSTTTGDIEETPTAPLRNAELPSLQRCRRCKLPYAPGKSTSELRLTYCSFLCELGDLGFSISGLEHMERAKREKTEDGAGSEAPGETASPA